ncbi:MAG: hypothetical protein QNK05_15715 [Myxococcota bacterium]|nr:hypothetical protein [Myxococcota bacterium]
MALSYHETLDSTSADDAGASLPRQLFEIVFLAVFPITAVLFVVNAASAQFAAEAIDPADRPARSEVVAVTPGGLSPERLVVSAAESPRWLGYSNGPFTVQFRSDAADRIQCAAPDTLELRGEWLVSRPTLSFLDLGCRFEPGEYTYEARFQPGLGVHSGRLEVRTALEQELWMTADRR